MQSPFESVRSIKPSVPADLSRYARQVVLPEIGSEGQRKLASARALVLGVGALGSSIAGLMVRAGVGFVRIVDRDYLEMDNLQRQVLYDEDDVAAGLPKAVAAADRLRRANSSVIVEPVVADVTPSNIERLVAGCHLVLDGSDNLEVRLLLNDTCLKLGVPWIYGAVIGTIGSTFTIIPGDGPCFRCLVPVLHVPGAVPTCETAGVLGPVPLAIATLQATEALKLLCGRREDLVRPIRYVDLWQGIMESVPIDKGPGGCPACDDRRFDFLEGGKRGASSKMCGRNAVQVDPGPVGALEFVPLALRLSCLGEVSFNPHMLRFKAGDREMALFPDGRAILKGVSDEGAARSLYARLIGT